MICSETNPKIKTKIIKTKKMTSTALNTIPNNPNEIISEVIKFIDTKTQEIKNILNPTEVKQKVLEIINTVGGEIQKNISQILASRKENIEKFQTSLDKFKQATIKVMENSLGNALSSVNEVINTKEIETMFAGIQKFVKTSFENVMPFSKEVNAIISKIAGKINTTIDPELQAT